jgi:serine/threonine-protein kinase RsbW
VEDTITLPAVPSMVRVARYAASVLLDGAPRTQDALQVVSELATNAILHSRSRDGGTFDVRIQQDEDSIRIEVGDSGPAPSPVREDDGFEAYNRGLLVVDGLAEKYGTDTYPDRAVWWAVLDR